MFAVNKDYNSYFKVVKPEVELSFEGYEDASKVAAILMKQGYVVTMYLDDAGADVYCLYATYVGDNGYDFERMAAFIDTSTEMAGLRQHDDVFPDDAEQLEDEDDSDSDNNPEKWDDEDEGEAEGSGSYYYLGYSDGRFDYKHENNYDNSKFDDDDYVRGYNDGWDEAVADEDEAKNEEDDTDYYELGYWDGEYDRNHGGNYNDSRFDDDEYAQGYEDGWDDTEDALAAELGDGDDE